MRPLDWFVLVGCLILVVGYGTWRGHGSNTVKKYMLAGNFYALVCDRFFDYGDTSQRHHVHIHDGSIVCRWHAFRAVLLRAADCNDHLVGDPRAELAVRSSHA